MPDKRKHRGRHPEDERLFAESQHSLLLTAVEEYAWLLTRAYAPDSALKLVGDHHGLTARQRVAIMRSTCSDESLRRRRTNLVPLEKCTGRSLGVDGYNLLITIECALSGGLILIGRDGCCRDLASIHGTYRRVEETRPALELTGAFLATLDISRVDWYLDRPVSNSGRLKAFMADVLEQKGYAIAAGGQGGQPPTWNIELLPSPDAELCRYSGLITSSDSAILDRSGPWVNLALAIIEAHIPRAWIVDFRPASPPIARE
jgi:hypothetical protein